MREPLKARIGFFVLAGILRPLIDIFLSRQWSGLERLKTDTGTIVVANHVTEIDPVVVGHMLYTNKVKPHFLAKDSLFRLPLFGPLLKLTQQVPVVRGSIGANRSLVAARTILDQGGAVVVYPEGTLTRDPDQWPMKGHTGAARLALELGAPVIPVAHWGAQELLPRYSKKLHLFPRKKVRVLVGEPIDLSEFTGVDRATVEAATEKIMDAITELVASLRQEPPPAQRWDPRATPEKHAEKNKAPRRTQEPKEES